ncbi:hypothetical protein Tco_0241380 [Tanacetum coccineum]
MRRWEELIRENVFRLGGNRDYLLACIAYMLYCIVAEEQYNLAYFFVKRIECARSNPTDNLPYGMFLTRLYRHIMEHYPYLDNGIYNVVDRVMRPLALKQTRKPQSDHGKACYSVSSTPAHHNRGSSSYQGDDDEDDGASRASTPSPTTYLNSLKPLDYQQYDIPTSSQQDDDLLFERQTDLLNQTQQMRKELRGGFKSFGKTLCSEVVKQSEVVKCSEVVKRSKGSSQLQPLITKTKNALIESRAKENIQSDNFQYFTVTNGNPSSVNIKQHCVIKDFLKDKEWQRKTISFQDDANLEHVGPKTQDHMMDKNSKTNKEDLKISEQKTKSTRNDKGLRSKITNA